MRVGIGGVFQETNTYVTEWTGAGSIDRFVVTAHAEMLDAYRGSLTEIGGAIAGAADLGVEAIPLTFAMPRPAPPSLPSPTPICPADCWTTSRPPVRSTRSCSSCTVPASWRASRVWNSTSCAASAPP